MALPRNIILTRYTGLFDLDGLIKLRCQAGDPSCPPRCSLYIYSKDVGGVSHLMFEDDACVVHDLSTLSPPGQTTTVVIGQPPAVISESIDRIDELEGELAARAASSISLSSGATPAGSFIPSTVGPPGIDGEDGIDSFIPGPQGILGPQGIMGPPGMDADPVELIDFVLARPVFPYSLTDIQNRSHSLLQNLSADDHTQYALLAGRSGGQILIGGTASGDDLTLKSTSNATKGTIFLGTASAYDEANDRLGLGTTTPSYGIQMTSKKYFQDGTVTDNSASHAALEVDTTLNGNSGGASGEQWGFRGAPTFAPSASISETNGFRIDAVARPPTGSTITSHRGGRFVVYSGPTGAGSITSMFGLQVVPVYEGHDPTNTTGIKIEDWGNAGTTTAIGIDIEKPTGATNNFYMRFGTADNTDPTGGGGAATGRIVVSIAGTLRYIPYY